MCYKPRYTSVKELQAKIDEYFDNIGNDGHDGVITVTGLALYLGFCSRQSFYDYEKRDKYSYTIKKARLRIENDYEIDMRVNPNAGNIFALKNFGWDGDKPETNVNTNINLSGDDLARAYEELESKKQDRDNKN